MTAAALIAALEYRGYANGAEIAKLRLELEDARCDLERCNCSAVTP